MNVPYQRKSEERRSHNGVIAYCDHCGHAIYSPDDAVIVEATDEIIHRLLGRIFRRAYVRLCCKGFGKDRLFRRIK